MEKKKISADTEKVKVRLSGILKNIRNEIDLLQVKEGPLKSNPYIVMMKESKWDTNFFLSEYQLIQKKQSHLSSNQRKIIIAAVTTAINEVVMAEQKKNK